MMDEALRLNALSEQIIAGAIAVHRALGPGLLESAYEACLYYELATGGLRVQRQKPLPLVYRGVSLDCAYKLDLVIEQSVVIEVKAVTRLDRVHVAQMISYLKIADLRLGIILNFNVRNLSHEGVTRKVNRFPE